MVTKLFALAGLTLALTACGSSGPHVTPDAVAQAVTRLESTGHATGWHDKWTDATCGPVPKIAQGAQMTCSASDTWGANPAENYHTAMSWLVTFQDDSGAFIALTQNCSTCPPVSGKVG